MTVVDRLASGPRPAVGPPAPISRAPWRRQPPVYSPVSWSGLLAGVRAATSEVAAQHARDALTAVLTEQYAPRDVVLTDSGTSALTAAIAATVCDRPGAGVALPAFACYDLATAADGAGAPVVLYDVDPQTLAPDLDSVRRVLRGGSVVIVVAHLYGYPIDLTEVNRLAADSGAVVIEDAAQAAGATLDEVRVGAQASLTVLSFGRGKGWTGGGGGALLAFDEAGRRALRAARALLGTARWGWGELAALGCQLLFARPSLYALPASLPVLRLGQTVYRPPHELRGAPAASCAVITASRPLAERELPMRRANADRLLVAVQGRPGFETIRAAPQARPGYLRLPVVTSPAVRRAAVEARATRLGVSPAYPQALCDLRGFAARCVNRDAAFPGSRLLASRLCTFPTHGLLSRRDLSELVSWIHAVDDR
jgi:dTDP-4-amino-4,6-dideoxygalactose transaminase